MCLTPPLLRCIISTIHLGLRVLRFCIFFDRDVSPWGVLIKPRPSFIVVAECTRPLVHERDQYSLSMLRLGRGSPVLGSMNEAASGLSRRLWYRITFLARHNWYDHHETDFDRRERVGKRNHIQVHMKPHRRPGETGFAQVVMASAMFVRWYRIFTNGSLFGDITIWPRLAYRRSAASGLIRYGDWANAGSETLSSLCRHLWRHRRHTRWVRRRSAVLTDFA